MQMIPGVDIALCRTPEIMADAAWHILTNTSGATGNFYIDDAVLQAYRPRPTSTATPSRRAIPVFCPICLWIDGAARLPPQTAPPDTSPRAA